MDTAFPTRERFVTRDVTDRLMNKRVKVSLSIFHQNKEPIEIEAFYKSYNDHLQLHTLEMNRKIIVINHRFLVAIEEL